LAETNGWQSLGWPGFTEGLERAHRDVQALSASANGTTLAPPTQLTKQQAAGLAAMAQIDQRERQAAAVGHHHSEAMPPEPPRVTTPTQNGYLR
jgi:hypothetical protein